MSKEPQIDLYRYTYSPEERRTFFEEIIVPKVLLAPKAIEQHLERPAAVFIAGQPGAGKTATTNAVLQHLSSYGGAVKICGDDFKAEIPYYQECLERDPKTAGAYGRVDARALHRMAEEWAAQNKVNTVIETALTGPEGFENPARDFRNPENGEFQVEVVALSTHEALSRQGILYRYQAEVDRGAPGRVVTTENHNNCYRGMAETAGLIDENHLAHVVRVWERGAKEVHSNRLDANGQWQQPPRFRTELEGARAKPWPEEVTAQFVHIHTQLTDSMAPSWRGELEEVWRLGKPMFHPNFSGHRNPVTSSALQSARPTKPVPKSNQPMSPTPSPKRPGEGPKPHL